MKNTKVLLTMLICGTMIVGCKKKEEEKAPAEAPAEATKLADPAAEAPVAPEVAPEAMAAPPFAAVIQHKVADFDKWKVGFDAHMQARKGAGILGHHLSRGVEDPNMVMVYLPMAATEKFTEMLASDDMKKAMKEAGVQGEPKVTMMKPVDGKPITDRDIPGAVIIHEVDNFDTWKAAFDEHAETRTKAGIIGHAVNRAADNENQVVVLIQAEKAEELTAFLGSEDLKAVMAKAGVKGEPEIMMISSFAGAMYE